ncbi:MAG TPA: hypothetical protein VJT54_04800 [Verrucomicrobiae bacterium]|nr:hypothetical protein [Verrucomicrobiae bacterium]
MEVFSHYGVGIKAFAIERKPNGRVEFTLWATVFFMPVWPLSSWSAIYAGPVRPDGIKEDGHRFDDPVRIQRDFISSAQTFTAAILVLAIAIAPVSYFIFRTTSRGATPLEMILVFAACAWPVVLVNLVERRRRKLLTGRWA